VFDFSGSECQVTAHRALDVSDVRAASHRLRSSDGPGGWALLDVTEERRAGIGDLEGATNWFSTSFNPATGLYYVQTLERCTIYTKTPGEWQPGKSDYGGSTKEAPEEPAQKILRAIDVKTGAITWELPQTGPARSWGGTLATATGLVFFGEDSGALLAVDASSGAPLWHFQTNTLWKASPMT
jgi:alcohol dehydrogenase (cytochrome c)